MVAEPTTLQEAVVYFASADNCREYVVPRRWPNGVICPTCGSDRVKFQIKHNRWQCTNRHPRRQFTLKTGTVMEDSPIGLDKWLTAMWLVASNRNGISSWELHRALGITQKTAWFLLHRVRLAMQDELTGGSLAGEVEIDETFIGGKARFMHKDRKRRVQKFGRNTGGKAIVMGMPKAPENDVVAEAIAMSKRATELREAAIAQLLAQRQQIDHDLQTLGFIESSAPNGGGKQGVMALATKAALAVTQARTQKFRDLTLAQIGKLLLAEHGSLHGKAIEKLAKAGGFKGGTKNFQNYMPVAFKRAGGFQNVGGNTWKLKETAEQSK